MQNIRRRSLVLAAAGLAFGGAALAQDTFPSRPIKWIVPYLAGTAPDTTVRIVAEAMGEILKQPVVIENKGGVAGNLGAQLAAKAAPDGYTWVYSAAPMSTSMRMYRKPGFDVMKDFTHVGRIAQSDVLLVVNADSGITTVKQLIERGRKEPGKLAFASGGVGSPAHMGAELMLNATNLAFVSFSRQHGSLDGQIFALSVMAVAAAAVPGVRGLARWFAGSLVVLGVAGLALGETALLFSGFLALGIVLLAWPTLPPTATTSTAI